MVTDREAKIWMVAALAVFVWACTMVGCAQGPASGAADDRGGPADALAWLTPGTAETQPASASQWASPAIDTTASVITITPDVGQTLPPLTADADRLESLAALTPVVALAPARPDWVRLRPQRFPDQNPPDLRGLSIAHPLLSARRLLVAGVTQLQRLPQPTDAWLALRVTGADIETRPLAAAVAADLRHEAGAPSFEAPVQLAGLVLEQPAWFIQDTTPPTPPRPLPAPALGAALTNDEAKFDSAGIIGIVLGAMVLLFGGEAVVLWMLNRHQAAAKTQLREALVADAAEAVEEDGEPSIFRLPEPIEDEAADPPRSKAA